jgi:2-oxoisovalerate dehydrogenase E2 component (dihydrolipoyl transacylase)
MKAIMLPELGEGIGQATVAELHCGIGDHIKKEDDVLEVVTDKATFNVSSEHDGIVEKICVDVGSEPRIGDCLVILKDE